MRGEQVGIAYCDVSVAFNTISHKILIDKMMKYGLDEQRGSARKLAEQVGPDSGEQWYKV